MEPTLDVGQRVLVNRFLYHFKDPQIGDIVVFHPPAGRRGGDAGVRGPEDRRRRISGAACDEPTPRRRRQLHQADRRRPGGHAERSRTATRWSTGSTPRRTSSAPARRAEPAICPKTDHHSARSLLHDGRQPWGERRQPLLGTSPPRLDHRQGIRHLLAAGPRRDLLSPREERRKRRTAARLFRFDRSFGRRFVAGVDEAGRGSLAGPLVAAGVLIDLERIGRRERRALARLDDSKQKSPEEREELYPHVIRAAAARLGRGALGARDRPPRPPRLQSRGARRTACSAVAPAEPSAWWTASGCPAASSSTPRWSTATPAAPRSRRLR